MKTFFSKFFAQKWGKKFQIFEIIWHLNLTYQNLIWFEFDISRIGNVWNYLNLTALNLIWFEFEKKRLKHSLIKGALKIHLQNLHKDHKDIDCDKCEGKFKSQLMLKQHVKYHHKNPTSYLCDICDKTFKLKPLLTHHKKVVHEDDKKLSCALCEKKFNSSNVRSFHYKTVHEKEFGCQLLQKKNLPYI